MSKFSERLSSLGQAAPARMGFGRSAAREKNPVMLVVGRGGDAKKGAGSVDLRLLSKAPGKEESDWGIEIDGSGSHDLEKLRKNGCQFALISSEDATAAILLSEEIAAGIPVTGGLPDARVRAIEDGPFEFLLYRPDSISWPLTVGSTLALQEVVSSFSTHIFLELPSDAALPGKEELEILKNLPISALVVDLDAVKSADVDGLKEAIASLEPRKPPQRGNRSPLVPLAGRNTPDESETGEEFEDEGDWED